MNERVVIRRRRLVQVAVGVPVFGIALTACTGQARRKRSWSGDPDADAPVRWSAVRTEQGLLALHAATVAEFPGLEDRLAPFTAHHRDHLDALLDDGPLPHLAPAGDGGSPGDDGAGDEAEGAGSEDDDGEDGSAGPDSDPGTGTGIEALLGVVGVTVDSLPDDADDMLDLIAEAERTASDAHATECLRATAPRLTALLASMTAAEAVHGATLEAS